MTMTTRRDTRLQRSKSCSSVDLECVPEEISSTLAEVLAVAQIHTPATTVSTSPQTGLPDAIISPTSSDTSTENTQSQPINSPLENGELSESEQVSIQDMIKSVMLEYQKSLENLTSEITSLRSEILDHKVQFNAKIKLLNHNQVTLKQDFEEQLAAQNKQNHQQQSQLKNQLKQQINNTAVENKQNVPVKPINRVNSKKQQPNQPQLNQPKTKQAITKVANAAAGATTTSKQPDPHLQSATDNIRRKSETPVHKQNTTNTNSAMVFGSSIVRHVNGSAMWKKTQTSVKINCYPGAGIQEISEHAEIRLNHLKGKQPATAIIHGGGNDLANDISSDEIITDMKKLGEDLIQRGFTNIGFSSVTPRTGLKDEVPILNNLMKEMCRENDHFHYISNSYISYKYDLSKDKVHLNFDGVWRLEKNFSYFLQKVKGMKD